MQDGNGLQTGDWSNWTVVRDHTHKKLYYVSGFNNIPQSIDLTALDFACKADTHCFPHFPSIAVIPPPAELAWHQDATKSFRATERKEGEAIVDQLLHAHHGADDGHIAA
ncbi:hypothetical protein EKH80_06420 [Dyella choica]|uniref:Uncharacterized protein n=1 Tax=Dyella choica TaxID=1927959 RepID=A0A3S0R4R2_9GAMM|nr:hypothetical protein EKH80_06420 [Dyella choica]